VRVVDLRVEDANDIAQMLCSGLLPLVVEDGADQGERIVVRARTPQNGPTEGVNTKTERTRARCTAEQASPCSATASSSDSATLRHHRT
jgi:hypothetical protein